MGPRAPLATAWFLARKDLAWMLRERETLLWTFVMPVLFFFFVGGVTGGGDDDDDGPRRDALALAVPADAGWLVDRLVAHLQAEDFDVRRDLPPEELAAFRRRLAVPERFTERVRDGEPVDLHFARRGAGQGADLDELRVSLAVYTLLADIIVAGGLATGEGGAITEEALAAVDALPRPLALTVRPAGRREQIPGGFEQAVPGTMVMFTMMLMLTTGATVLMLERKQGVLRRLASAPVGRGAVVLGKWGGKLGLGLVQLAYAMVVGALLFDVEWGTGAALAMLVAVLVAWAALCASLGLLLGSVTKTEGQAVGIAVIATLSLAALGGCWWPIEITPPWMRDLAMLLPTGWTMDALHRLVSFGDPPSAVLPHLALLAGGAAAAGAAATRVFRFE